MSEKIKPSARSLAAILLLAALAFVSGCDVGFGGEKDYLAFVHKAAEMKISGKMYGASFNADITVGAEPPADSSGLPVAVREAEILFTQPESISGIKVVRDGEGNISLSLEGGENLTKALPAEQSAAGLLLIADLIMSEGKIKSVEKSVVGGIEVNIIRHTAADGSETATYVACKTGSPIKTEGGMSPFTAELVIEEYKSVG